MKNDIFPPIYNQKVFREQQEKIQDARNQSYKNERMIDTGVAHKRWKEYRAGYWSGCWILLVYMCNYKWKFGSGMYDMAFCCNYCNSDWNSGG